MSHSRLALLVIGIVLISLAAPVAAATPTPAAAPSVAAGPVCNGKYEGRLKSPSHDELVKILEKHAEWLIDSRGGYDSSFANDPRIANLCDANLVYAHLEGANLDGAHLNDGHLTGADLTGAHLNGADLTGAQVAKLAGVDLTGATYAPVSETPDPYEGCLRTAGFEWTTAYGLHPERALRLILLLGAILTPVHMFAMRRPTAASGVMQVFPADRFEGTAGDPADEEKRKKQLVHAKSWRAALRTAAYFSLISAVNIGFEQFTPGDWIRRLQTREYSLEAVGWIWVVAGVQALL